MQAIPSLRQVDWKLVATGSPQGGVSANRIYYARVPEQVALWKSRMPQVQASLRQDFSRYGFLAVFLTTSDGFTIDGVYSLGNGGLNIQLRMLPPPAPPSCTGPGPCPTIPPPPPPMPRYLLISIRKGSIPTPVQRLYISETTSDPPPLVIHDPPPPPPSDAVTIGDNTSAVPTVIPRQWKNCTVVNKRFPHGVGKLHAHDRTKSGTPVTNFRRSTLLYTRAMRYNRSLDRDHDGIACEKL